jgi:hypothetical protein
MTLRLLVSTKGIVEHDDEIGHADRRETVGDEDRDAAAVVLVGAARRCGVALEQRVFSLRVQRGGRFVEDRQQRLTSGLDTQLGPTKAHHALPPQQHRSVRPGT